MSFIRIVQIKCIEFITECVRLGNVLLQAYSTVGSSYFVYLVEKRMNIRFIVVVVRNRQNWIHFLKRNPHCSDRPNGRKEKIKQKKATYIQTLILTWYINMRLSMHLIFYCVFGPAMNVCAWVWLSTVHKNMNTYMKKISQTRTHCCLIGFLSGDHCCFCCVRFQLHRAVQSCSLSFIYHRRNIQSLTAIRVFDTTPMCTEVTKRKKNEKPKYRCPLESNNEQL